MREIVEVYFDRRVSRSAAELAYFLILSFFPVLICVNAFVGLLHLDVNLILAGTEEFLPKESRSILGDYILYITDNQSNAMLFAGLTMTLFSASAAFRALMNIMADIYGRTTYRGVGQVVASVAFSVLFLITIYLSLAVLLTGSWFLHLVETYLPWVRQVVGDWQWIRFWVLFCLVMLFVLLTYRMAAPRGKPRPPILTGGVLASAALVCASMLFSWFIGMSSRYSLVYGSLASVIILLVWLYLCGNILILGNVFNYVWYRRKKVRYET
ncbi:YihY/virulence factor BrkB family protein [Intestinimonas butyriciproducens]|uniref:YihY/virulence factor BrkB family protein n=1 Tax=Intestinimonas butyriciproducens TaxID=1297617 RepID=UPI001FA71B81|nr:YihY/virulence factor BrkB family protein [Intestinimonas butyriciproducens]